MPKYIYKFCDGTVSEVEVSDEHYTLLKELDKQERENNRRHRRKSTLSKTPVEMTAKKGADE